ncbi:alpha/beta hydrolase [Spirosoma areae]
MRRLFSFIVLLSNCFAPISLWAQSHASIPFQTVAFKTYTGDTITYELGWLAVPENRLKNPTNTIELAVVRLKAKNARSDFPVVFLAGGPGQSGINYLNEEYFQRLVFPLQQTHDVILLDQRGCGQSRPSLLYALPEADNREIFLSNKRMLALGKEAIQAGTAEFKAKGIDIAGYTTLQNAHDLRDLCGALGTKKLNLLGVSYGTHLALVTARAYPALIERMALIGTSGVNHMHHLPATYDEQLRKIAQLAAQDSLVNKAVPDMISLLRRVLQQLDRQPIQVQIEDKRAKQVISIPVGKFGLQTILRLDAGDSYDFVSFPAMLYGIDQGDYALLQEYIEKRYNQFNGGYGSGISVMRQASGATQERYQQIAREGKTALLNNAMNTPDIYSQWPGIDLGDEYRQPIKSGVNTLFISGTLDSNTPASNVEELKEGFPNSLHVLAQYAGHEDMLPNEAVQKMVIDFFNGVRLTTTTVMLAKPTFMAIEHK